ncbi:uncharacterized protein EHS24_002250 [Apiotrichum porosum]|uniref:Uncharacterized protein n=1 Tax=Apiotrichum porosum TaxID=105984 RepID=A0A427XI21_9TREE|nr:uncharacterized protein EHS24_002250 [Apiotrichum porosum]RSH78525.1 hypothetical protein EHS24_002250 [Apiotrichum porosum]
MDATALYLRLHATSPKGVPYKDMFIFISIRHPLYCLVSLEIAGSYVGEPARPQGKPHRRGLALTLSKGDGPPPPSRVPQPGEPVRRTS